MPELTCCSFGFMEIRREGEFHTSLSGLAVLAANVAMMLTGGSIALAIQRARTSSKAQDHTVRS
jgi:hypothetical protein